MMFVILLDCPILSRSKLFAESLAATLTDAQVFDLSLFSKDSVPPFTGQDSPHVSILYAEGALLAEPWRQRADLTIYLEASQMDITVDVFGSLQERRSSERTLAEEVQSILKEKAADQGPTMFADIVIASDEKLEEAVASVSGYIERIDPKTSRTFLDAERRRARLEQMMRDYQHATMKSRKAKIKRRLWLFVVTATLAFKRLLDIVFSLTALLMLSPLFLVVALLIKLYDRGPVFYVQKRVGLHGKEFPFPKFRSMVRNADALKDTLLQQADRKGDITFKMKRDPRITPIGRFIRRFSIDELPQFWCVFVGDMSIVGPRPPVPREVALYSQEDRRRLEVKPGLTGIWQVSGRAEIGFKQQVELDVLYIESHGFWLDLKLILKTIPAVLTGKGAY